MARARHRITNRVANNNKIKRQIDFFVSFICVFFVSDGELQQEENQIIRTDQYNSIWLNLPQFVGSFEAGEYVYFVFREPAVEHINCGKVSAPLTRTRSFAFFWDAN